MIEVWVLALIVAKIKKYSLKPLLKAYPLYPIYALEVFLIFLNATIFFGEYRFIPIGSIVKFIYMVCLALPLLYYRQYVYSLIGAAFTLVGSGLNEFVIAQNGGKMPVYPTLSNITGYAIPLFEGYGYMHVLADEQTKWLILGDWIDLGYSIISIGDVFVRVLGFLAFYGAMKSLHLKAATK